MRELLLRYPNVILWVNGHAHRNQIPRTRAPPGLSDTTSLAALFGALPANDWHGRGDFRRGEVFDRNVELIIPSPLAG